MFLDAFFSNIKRFQTTYWIFWIKYFWIFFSIFLKLVDFFPRLNCSLMFRLSKTNTCQCLTEKEWSRQGFGSSTNSKSTSSMVETYLAHGRARSKKINCPAVTRSHKKNFKNEYILKYFRLKLQTCIRKDLKKYAQKHFICTKELNCQKL